jgi:hypothetical protein
MGILWDGELRTEGGDAWEAAAIDLFARVVARGRIVARHRETGPSSSDYRVEAALVEHPDLPPGEVYALLYNRHSVCPRVYRCTPEAAIAALDDHGIFNLA